MPYVYLTIHLCDNNLETVRSKCEPEVNVNDERRDAQGRKGARSYRRSKGSTRSIASVPWRGP